MEPVLAKSDGTTLQQHIADCLQIARHLRDILPALSYVTGLDNFWELLFYAIYLHDIGKCHNEFQKILTGQQNFWKLQRHEIYSVPFVEKLDIPMEQKILVKRAILAHHKDFAVLLGLIKSKADLEFELELKWKRNKKWNANFHPEDFGKNLQKKLNLAYIQMLFAEMPSTYSEFFGKKRKPKLKIISLSNQENPVQKIVKNTDFANLQPNQKSYWQNMLLWGAMKISDHYGSAKIDHIEKLVPSDFSFLDGFRNKLKSTGKDYFTHQLTCFQTIGNCQLIAPTGSGKTEAAIGWLRRQLESNFQGRAYYVLPYTASINAMFHRLKNQFSAGNHSRRQLIGIQYGKLNEYIASYYEALSETREENIQKNKKIKQLADLYRKLIFPIKIITPFQILKHLYGVKGFEMGLTELAGAKLIFDEIHAYDEITLAQIVVGLKYLTDYLNVQVLVMTATMPSFLMDEIKHAIHVSEPIWADPKLLKEFTRHRVRLLNGNIFENFDWVVDLIRSGKRTIVVCNTLKNAQAIYQMLVERDVAEKQRIVLLHGRFNSIDRIGHEKRALDEKNKVLIGTQAIEVSLDIDYDVIVSEPAPIDALFQRFGRVNRRRKKGISDVFVCKEGGEFDHLIYSNSIVENTIELLKDMDVIYENKMQAYLDFVYKDWEKEKLKNYLDTKINFEQSLLALKPFSFHLEDEEEFYEKFDGIQVLPAPFFRTYKKLIGNYDFYEAERYLVSISRGMYFRLKNLSQIEKKNVQIQTTHGKIIERTILVAKCTYSPEIGMTDSYEEISDFDDGFI